MNSVLWISHTNFMTSFSFYVTSGNPLDMVLWCTFRVILGFVWGCPLLSFPHLWLGPLFPLRSRSGTCWPCLVLYCTAEKLPCVLGSEPCVTQLPFKGYKGKGFASRLNTSKPWQQLLDQTERKEVACGSPKQTGVSEAKTGSRRILLRNNEKKTAHLCGTKAWVLKKLSKLLPHPINIFSSTYGMSLSQLPPPDIPFSDYP